MYLVLMMVTVGRAIPSTADTSSSLGRICLPGVAEPKSLEANPRMGGCLPGQPHLKFRGHPPDGRVPSRATDRLKFRGFTPGYGALPSKDRLSCTKVLQGWTRCRPCRDSAGLGKKPARPGP